MAVAYCSIFVPSKLSLVKDFTDTYQVVFKQLGLDFFFPRLLTETKSMTKIGSGEKLFEVCDFLLLLFIFNIHLHK